MALELELIQLQYVVLENNVQATRDAVGRAIDVWRAEEKLRAQTIDGLENEIRNLRAVLRIDDRIFKHIRRKKLTKRRGKNGTTTS
jgi:hypothetical protein